MGDLKVTSPAPTPKEKEPNTKTSNGRVKQPSAKMTTTFGSGGGTFGGGGGPKKAHTSFNYKPPNLSPERARQLEIEAYYKNYDAMDGLVTAIVLGGFFAFVCLMVVYKTKCKPMW